MPVAALIVAAGRGSRAGGPVPKQYRDLAGRPVLGWTLERFLSTPGIDAVWVVIHPRDEPLYRATVASVAVGPDKLREWVAGGPTRQDSVRLGLEALAAALPSSATVLIHDGARPFAGPELIERAIEAGRAAQAAVPGVPVTDTVKRVDASGRAAETLPRESLRAVQTPQVFRLAPILAAHRAAAAAGLDSFTDDGALAEWAGLPVLIFEGDPMNSKLTLEDDFGAASRRLDPKPSTVARHGTGFDVHRFADGDHVWLGGIRVPHSRGVDAHSDGDVILHALTDALLGAIADGDIGVHFPPSDPQWRGASSDRFLAFAAQRVRARGGIIDHLDVTVLCEAPRLGPHREAIRARIAAIAGLSLHQVSLKATTTETLGFIGRAEGLAAQAAASVRVPERST